MKTAELIATLRDIALSVKAGDSFEGSISYSCMDEGLEPGEFEVAASYRIWNSEGQGGLRIILPTVADDLPEPEEVHSSPSIIERIINDISERPDGEGPDDPSDPDIVVTTKKYLRICMERWLPHAYWPKA